MNSTTSAPIVAVMNPAPWLAPYQPIALADQGCKECADDAEHDGEDEAGRIVGAGRKNRAISPATKPTRMTHKMPPISALLSRMSMWQTRLASDPVRQFAVGRHPPVGRQMVDHAGQILAQPIQQFLARQAGLMRHRVDLIDAHGLTEIAGRDLCSGPCRPMIRGFPLAALLQLLQQVAEPSRDHAARSAAGEHAAKAALQQVAETSADAAAGRPP